MTGFAEKHFRYIKASTFLPEYCDIENTTATYNKIRGVDGNRKPTDFTDAEKKKIKRGLRKLVKELTTVTN